MRMKKALFLYVFLSCIVLSGCVTLDLRQANHELANLYRVKSEAVKSENWEQEVTANGALSVLADQAAKECNAKTISEINRISFCRIAATAAWQAGSTNVLNYADAGMSLCNKNDNISKVPRDCGMLLVIPNLASADELTERYNQLNKRITDGSNPPTDEEVAELFKDIRSRINSLLKNRNTIIQSNAHRQLIKSLDEYISTLLCRNLQETLGLIVQYGGVGSDAHKKAQCDDYKLKVKLKQLGFSQKTVQCLPSGVPRKPSGCQ